MEPAHGGTGSHSPRGFLARVDGVRLGMGDKPLNYVKIKRNVGRNRCCLCGRKLSGETLQITGGYRAHLKCVVKYSFNAHDEEP